jgi:hypothetical protein
LELPVDKYTLNVPTDLISSQTVDEDSSGIVKIELTIGIGIW